MCWVFSGARIEDDARVSGNAIIYAGKIEGAAQISGYAKINLTGSGRISDAVRINGEVEINTNSVIEDNVIINGEKLVMEGMNIKENVRLTAKPKTIVDEITNEEEIVGTPAITNSEISGDVVLDVEDTMINGSTIQDLAKISGRPLIEDSTVKDHGKVSECASIRVGSEITERGQVMGSTQLIGVVLNKQAYVATKSEFRDMTISTCVVEEYDLEVDCPVNWS
jgi:bifunctional N-acetylglucosamine-1-phosphate-uridyltransferase/glucosamine-1-phosphate-acetyltransferase GlmU-like protein